MIEYGYKNDNDPYVEGLSVTYCQGDDNNGKPDEYEQKLMLTSCDCGGGPFIRMSIPHEQSYECSYWSLSDISDLFKIFEDFEEKVNYPENTSYYYCPPDKLLDKIYSKLEEHGCRVTNEDRQYVKEHWSK